MRTKTLLLTAACAVIGTVAASAQSVYSVNAVGYVNLTIPTGVTIIANPLNTSNNALSVVIPNPPDSTTVYLWTGSKFNIYNYYDGLGWDNDATFAPGSAAWIKNTSGAATTITFVGEVPQGTLTNAVPAGMSFKASIVPQAGALDTVLQYTPSDSDCVYLWRNNNWVINNYYDGLGWDQGSAPSPAVGEGFWLKSSTAKIWTRTFSVN